MRYGASVRSELTYIGRKVHTEPVRLSEDLLENSVPLLADAADLSVRLDVHDPEDDVPAGTAVAAGHEAAAQGGRSLHHVLVLLLAVLDDVRRLEDAERLLDVPCQDPGGTVDGHGLGQTGTHQAVVAPHGSVYHHGNLPLTVHQLHLEAPQ